jgi:hypothetical protein
MKAYLSERNRRLLGFVVAAALGLSYLLLSQFVNVWALPNIPLYEPPIGRLETAIYGSVVIGILGLLIVWERESFWGLLVAALAGVVVTSVQAFINSYETGVLKSVIVFVFTFLPRVVFFLPMGIFFRWLVDQVEDVVVGFRGRLRDLVFAAIATVVIIVVGARMSIYPPEARRALQEANTLLLSSQSITDRDALPVALQLTDGFIELAKGPYNLEYSDDPDRLPVTRPRVGLDILEPLIIYRFENGYIFGCVFTPPAYVANCINISRVR